ncbi:MAG: LTA synthase family protein [Bacteroidota bacterium]
MPSEWAPLRAVAINLLLVLLLYAVLRWVFFAYNQTAFPDLSVGEKVRMSLIGLRFDLPPLLYFNSLYILLALLPTGFRQRPLYQAFLKLIFLLGNALALGLEMASIPYFPYSARRLIRSDFSIWSESLNLTAAYLQDFWALVVLFVLLMGLLFVAYRSVGKKEGPVRPLVQWAILLGTISLSIIGIRGGVQLRPIMPLTAAQYYEDARLGPLLSNTGLSVLFSLGQQQLEDPRFLTDQELDARFDLRREASARGGEMRKDNVVLIVLESFSQEYIGRFNKGPSHTPFLDSLLGEGYHTRWGLANGMRSTHGIVAISSSVPSLMDSPLMMSTYQANAVESIASLLGRKGYRSAFFHGANPGSMALEKFASWTGFEAFYDREDYEQVRGGADYDGNWGIWDEDFFDFTCQELSSFEEPFVGLLFSLTSHHPYKVPEEFRLRYPEMDEVRRSILYTDQALAKFFQQARQQDWFDRTLFVITADHLGRIVGGSPYLNSLGFFRIPILFYHPAAEICGDSTRVIQQIDLMPSVLDWLGYDEPYFAFGQSCFDSLSTPSAYMLHDGLYQIVDSTHLYQSNFKDLEKLYRYVDDPYLQRDLSPHQEQPKAALRKKLQAVVQRHHRAMIHNELQLRK